MNTRRVKLAVAAFAISSVMLASLAEAKDLCISVDGRNYVFRRVKALKPSGAISLAGVTVSAGVSSPVEGVASADSTGVVRVGLFVHRLASTGSNYTEEAVVDSSFAGTGKFDTNGDFASDGDTTWNSVDCSSVTFP